MAESAALDLITGSAGIVGTHLADVLARRGRRLRVLDLKRWPLYPPGTEVVIGDVRDRDVVRQAVSGVEHVYHLATLINHDRVAPAVLHSVIVDGGETVTSLAAEAGAKRVVVLTTTEVYGHLGSEPRSEDGPRRPLDEYGRAKKALEDRLFALAHRAVPASIVRPPVIIGPRFPFSPLPRLFWLLRHDLPVPVVAGECRIQYAHVDDVASIAVAATTTDASIGESFNVGSRDVLTMRQMLAGVRAYVGSRSPLVPLPSRATRAALRALSTFTSPLFLEPGQFEIIGDDYLLDLSKAARLLGWTPTRTNLEAFCDAYDWYLCMHPYPKPRHLRPRAPR